MILSEESENVTFELQIHHKYITRWVRYYYFDKNEPEMQSACVWLHILHLVHKHHPHH